MSFSWHIYGKRKAFWGLIPEQGEKYVRILVPSVAYVRKMEDKTTNFAEQLSKINSVNKKEI